MASSSEPPGARDRESLLTVSFAVNVAGIYACFISTSILHEAIYRARSPTTGHHISPWLVNAVEAGMNVLVALLGISYWEGVRSLPQKAWGDMVGTGSIQMWSKYLSSAARIHGVPGPVQTLVKTARPLPVMLGQRFLAGTLYTTREYAQYSIIVLASVLVGAAGNPVSTDSLKPLGMLCLVGSCVCDAYVGGRQKALKAIVVKEREVPIGPLEMQFHTNLYMFFTAIFFALVTGGPDIIYDGIHHLTVEDWNLLERVLMYATASAIGQVFVFTCMTRTDPLVLAVVTSSRKMLSVILLLVVFGYEVNSTCLAGLVLAAVGFRMIFSDEMQRRKPRAAAGRVAATGKKDSVVELAATASDGGNGSKRL